MARVTVVVGTRPEVIKLAPVVTELRCRQIDTVVFGTGQHAELFDQACESVGLEAGVRARVVGGSLTARTADLMTTLGTRIAQGDLVIVQGDTLSAYCGALAGFLAGTPVAHVEAGLRSFDLASPYPEEGFRAMISEIATLHFAPTERAADNLHDKANVHVVGNTVVDALLAVPEYPSPYQEPYVLVTLHRRESWGGPMKRLLKALPDMPHMFVFPAHPNTRDDVDWIVRGAPNVHMVDPLPYPHFVAAMRHAACILTDSGGVQEEAPTFGVPVVVARDVTERPEAVLAGFAEVAGTKPADVAAALNRAVSKKRISLPNPFGDGKASTRIVDVIERFLA